MKLNTDLLEGKFTDLKYNMIVSGDHFITLLNNSRYYSHTSNTCLKESTNSKVYSFLHSHLAESLRACSIWNSIKYKGSGRQLHLLNQT